MSTYDGRERGFGAELSLWYLVPLGVLLAMLAVGAIVAASLSGAGGPSTNDAQAADAASLKLPPWYTVRAGQTYTDIAKKTGLSVEQLETFNPNTNPDTIRPGQRIKLRLKVPPAKPKPPGPSVWTVRSGQSFGSIAAKTGHSIAWLRRLNPKLKPEKLQPGARMRLRE
jgi:LysM repeat protein